MTSGLKDQPWVVQAFDSYAVFGPGMAHHTDHSLAIYEAAGFTGTQFPRLRARLDTAAADYGAAPEHSLEFGVATACSSRGAESGGP
jgi:hypothetical protein